MTRTLFCLLFLFSSSLAFADGKVLVVLSSEDKLTLQNNTTKQTGFFLNELINPVKALLDAGFEIEFANPRGNAAILDPISDDPKWFSSEEEYRNARRLCQYLGICGEENLGTRNLRKLSTIGDFEVLNEYVGLFVPGGHAVMEDLVKDEDLGRLLITLHNFNRPIALLCHGPVALLSALENPQAFIDTLSELHKLETYADERKSDYEDIAKSMETLGKEAELLKIVLKAEPTDAIHTKLETVLTELHRKYHEFSSNKVLEEQSRESIDELKNELKTLSKSWAFADYNITSFSTEEEMLLKLDTLFYTDEALQYAGAKVDVSGEAWSSKVVVDHNLVTGRNVTSDKILAEEFLTLLNN